MNLFWSQLGEGVWCILPFSCAISPLEEKGAFSYGVLWGQGEWAMAVVSQAVTMYLGAELATFLGRSKLSQWPSEHTFSSVPSGWKANPLKGFQFHPMAGRVPCWVCFGLQIYCQVSGKISWKNVPCSQSNLNQPISKFTDSLFFPAGTVWWGGGKRWFLHF